MVTEVQNNGRKVKVPARSPMTLGGRLTKPRDIGCLNDSMSITAKFGIVGVCRQPRWA